MKYIPFKRDVEESGKILDRIVVFCVIYCCFVEAAVSKGEADSCLILTECG